MSPPRPIQRPQPRRVAASPVCGRRVTAGSTLIDVALGSAILSLLLLPALQLMGQSSTIVHRLMIQDALLFDAQKHVENEKIRLCDPAQFSGSAVSDNQPMTTPSVPLERVWLRSFVDGTIPGGGLRTIDVTVWQDLDRDGQVDAPEPQQRIRTQWCRP